MGTTSSMVLDNGAEYSNPCPYTHESNLEKMIRTFPKEVNQERRYSRYSSSPQRTVSTASLQRKKSYEPKFITRNPKKSCLKAASEYQDAQGDHIVITRKKKKLRFVRSLDQTIKT